jgi:hypothetical protein
MKDAFYPRNTKGNYDWNAIANGRYYVECYVGGTRRRVSAGVSAAQALEVQRRKLHEPEGRELGIRRRFLLAFGEIVACCPLSLEIRSTRHRLGGDGRQENGEAFRHRIHVFLLRARSQGLAAPSRVVNKL